MSRVVERARKALLAGERGSRGPEPRGDLAGIVACMRIDPSVIVEMHELTGYAPTENVFIDRIRDLIRLAATSASDAELATSVRSLLVA